MWTAVVAVLVGLAIGCLVGWLMLTWSRRQHERELQVERRLREQQADMATQNEARQKELMSAVVQAAMAKLTATSQTQLDENGVRLAALNKRAMADIIDPLKLSMKEFAAEVKSVKDGNARVGEQMSTHLQSLQTAAAAFGREAKGFTEAFVRGNKVQGNLGEAILEDLYLRAGLKRGVNFVSQEGNGNLIPDTIVFDAVSQRALVVDSKASYTDYLSACNATDEASRQAALRRHVASIKKHVRELSEKKYPEKLAPVRDGYAYLPLVAMFVPNEKVLDAALEVEPELMQYAYDNGVVLVTPLTLMGYFWMVKEGWKRHSLDKNAEKIAKLAELLVNRLDSAFVYVEQMEKSLAAMSECQRKLAVLMNQGEDAYSIKDVTLRISRLAEKNSSDIKSKSLKSSLECMPEI